MAYNIERFLGELAGSTLKPVTMLIFWNDTDFVDDVAKIAERNLYDRVSFVFAHPAVSEDSEVAKRFEMTTFPLDLVSITSGLRSTMPAGPEADEDIVLPIFRGMDESLEYGTVSVDVLNWLEEECEVLHMNLGIVQKDEPEYQGAFLRGRKIRWFELNLHEDIERDLTHSLERKVEQDLVDRHATRIKLSHHPGAGGTTVAYRVAWDLHWTYPVLVLRTISTKTVERIREVYGRTQQSVLLLVDSSSITVNLVDALYDQIRARQMPAVFLIVTREFHLPRSAERVFPLHQQLTTRESGRFASILGKEAPDKKTVLEKIAKGPRSEQRTPFYFALAAFEANFTGLEDFVGVRLEDISDQERKIIGLISLAYYFGQRGVPAQIFAFWVGLPLSRPVDLRKYLNFPRQDLLICDGGEWRPIHALVAKEILVQLLSGQKEREQWAEMLSRYAVETIDLLGDTASKVSGDLNKVISDILYSLFIERHTQDLVFGTSVLEGRSRFSDYIERIPTKEGKRLVFDALVEAFPYESHFWGHRSRLIWSYAKGVADYRDAIESIDHALAVSENERPDARLYHIKGMALAKWVTHLMEEVSREFAPEIQAVPEGVMSQIQEIYDQALETFKYIREELEITNERPYVSAIELLTRYIEFGKAFSSFESYADFFRSTRFQSYRSCLEEAEDLLRQVHRMRAGEFRVNRFVKEREIQLNKFYDDYSRIIEGWRNMLDRDDVYRPPYRRNLAYAYLARRKRNWDRLSQSELAIIRDLMEENLIAEPGNNHNIRLWFEAAKRLSSTSLNYAIEKLTYWVANTRDFEALDANYYLYLLQVVAAIEGSDLAIVQAQRTMERCKRLAQDRPNRTFSFEWVGKGHGISRLVHFSLLGKLSRETSFFTDTSRLERLSGRVDKINSPQSGSIKAHGLSFFFTPSPRSGHQFLSGRDENTRVTFFAGLSYDGPRAWDVAPVTDVSE